MRRTILQTTIVLIVTVSGALAPRVAQAVFASPVNGGCYMTAPNQCRVHIDPVDVKIAAGQRLELIRLQLNGNTIYDYRTDLSNPPVGPTYTFSPIGLDFAALCGKTYKLTIVGKDTGDVNPLAMGSTGDFTCPDRKAIKVTD